MTGKAKDVRAMYESYPYPSPFGASLIDDVASSLYSLFGDTSLEGRRILDAGCGTGQRLLAVAREYPQAHFVGLDMTAASIAAARALAEKHDLQNVEFCNADLLEFRPERAFDVILSIGVVHHLEDPCRGLQALASHLRESGVLIVWLYHSLGEHQRLLDREVLLSMWDRSTGLERGVQMMQDLGLTLEVKRYGSSAAQDEAEVDRLSIDVDAFLHPIVNAYRFEETIRMFRDCAHLTWSAINNINLHDTSKLVDLNEREASEYRYFCQSVDELFDNPSLRQRYRELSPLDKLRILENKLKPTGFTIVGGRGESHLQLAARAQGNVVTL